MDTNYEVKKAMFNSLKEKGIISGEYDSRFSAEEKEQLEKDQKEMANRKDYLDFKGRMSEKELADFNFVFNEE